MARPRAGGSPDSADASGATVREIMRDAVRFWEPRRVAYNLVLLVVVLVWLIVTWPHFRAALTFESLLALVVLALGANACYCVAYTAEIVMQRSLFRAGWRRRRFILWLVGTLLAAGCAWYWIADEIYPYSR
ncbi:MAG: hypothetical protein ACHQQS_15205 [Thermoanaerobaculales bacterium]